MHNNRSALTPWLTVCALAALAGCQSAGRVREPRPVSPDEIPQTLIRNLAFDGRIFSGGDATEAGLRALAERDVRAIVDLRLPEHVPAGEPARVRALGMEYAAVPMHSNAMSAANAAAVLEALERYADDRVALLCRSANRAGAMYGLYRGVSEELTVETALDLARRAGMRNEALAADVRAFLERRRAVADSEPAPPVP